jgi:hypothetical protein
MKVINFMGGPGCGKSTSSAGLFHLMKKSGYKVELVVEYAKELVYDKHFNILEDQMYVLAKQARRMKRLSGTVDYIITDSPLILTIVYNKGSETLNKLALEEFNKFYNINFMVNRTKKFEQFGRMQNLDESKEIDRIVENILLTNQFPYHRIDYVEEAFSIVKQDQAND